MKACVVLIPVCIIMTSVVLASYSEDVSKGLAENIIRLHVVANSDSQEDQALKRDVRDKILEYMKKELETSDNIGETRKIINKDIKHIEKLTEDEIIRQGKNYSVKAMLGSYPFPTKVYGDIALPAGNYEALKVVIGKGEGANWWCVLFPPLCFVDASHGTVPASVKQKLKKNLTNEEYKIITTADNDKDIPVKIKFKVVEFFKTQKIRFTGMINKIF